MQVSWFCNFKTITRHGNSDHLLVESSISFGSDHLRASRWRFNSKVWQIPELRDEITKEIQSANRSENWDLHKCSFQSIIRAFKSHPPSERRIQKLHKKLNILNNKIANTLENEEYTILAGNLKVQIQNEVAILSEKWRIRSNTKWIEEGEKSTKYFFSMYKTKNKNTCG